ncbi:MAG: phenylacetate--CoA ligase family protein [Gemmatimonadales bacterium]
MSATLGFWLAADGFQLLRAPRLAPDALQSLSRRRLARLLAAAARTEFHRERLEAIGLDSRSSLLHLDPEGVLASLAPVGKAELRAAGTGMLRGGRIRPEWMSSSSSGSTGEPFRVYYDTRAWATLKHLVKLRARAACGVRPTDRVALLDAIPPRQRQGFVRGSRVARISVLQPGAAMAEQLAAFRPDAVYGLPSALLEAAAALRAQGRQLVIGRVFTSGELLRPAVREAIADAFQARVFDIYGSSETKEIAWECAEGGMHVNADVIRLEVLDDEGRPLPDGVEGNLVATSLVNHAMPLLRYRLGDRGSMRSHACPCGRAFPLLGVVTGRAVDVLVLSDGRRVSPYALTCALEREESLLRYQVSQLDPARLRVRAIVEPGAQRSAVTDRVRALMRAEVAPFLETDVEFVDHLPTGPRAKFSVVQPLAVPAQSLG